jgi:hypothetical protein
VTAAQKTPQQKHADLNQATAERRQNDEAARAWVESATITYVSHIGGKVRIRYGFVQNDAHNEYELSSDDAPSPAFSDALQALAPVVAEIVFRDRKEREYQTPNIIVKSVNWKEHDEGNLHAGIGATLTLANGKTTALNIPQMPMTDDSGGESAAYYGEAAAAAIEEVLARTRDYMAGRRAQGNLFAKMEA